MPKYTVPLTTWANIAVEVETDETDPKKIAQLAQEQAGVSLCCHCAGNHGLEIGDEWDAVHDNKTGSPEVYQTSD